MVSEPIAKLAINWSDYTIFGLIILLAIVMTVLAIQYLNGGDKNKNRENKQYACGRHEWERDDQNKLFCTKCGKTPSNNTNHQLNGFDGP